MHRQRKRPLQASGHRGSFPASCFSLVCGGRTAHCMVRTTQDTSGLVQRPPDRCCFDTDAGVLRHRVGHTCQGPERIRHPQTPRAQPDHVVQLGHLRRRHVLGGPKARGVMESRKAFSTLAFAPVAHRLRVFAPDRRHRGRTHALCGCQEHHVGAGAEAHLLGGPRHSRECLNLRWTQGRKLYGLPHSHLLPIVYNPNHLSVCT